MDLEVIGITTAAVSGLLGANAYLTNIVITAALNKTQLDISKEYVTKQEFKDHMEQCPMRNG
ncbi:hypothetical protein [Staphylococcus aureus]